MMRILVVAALTITFCLSDARAELPPPPTGLVGDTYQLTFVSNRTTQGLSNDINYYNDFVQAIADTAGIGASEGLTWRAIVSTTAGVHARDNAPVSTQVFNMNGDLVADGFADMWDGNIHNRIQYNADGVEVGAFLDTWTGSTTDGFGAPGLTVGGTVNNRAWCGNSTQTDARWLDNLQPTLGTFLRVYAVSSVIVVPEPATLGFVALAGALLARRRR